MLWNGNIEVVEACLFRVPESLGTRLGRPPHHYYQTGAGLHGEALGMRLIWSEDYYAFHSRFRDLHGEKGLTSVTSHRPPIHIHAS